MDLYWKAVLTRLVCVYRTANTRAVFTRTEAPDYARREEERRRAELALIEGLSRCCEAFVYGGRIYSVERIGRHRELMAVPYGAHSHHATNYARKGAEG